MAARRRDARPADDWRSEVDACSGGWDAAVLTMSWLIVLSLAADCSLGVREIVCARESEHVGDSAARERVAAIVLL